MRDEREAGFSSTPPLLELFAPARRLKTDPFVGGDHLETRSSSQEEREEVRFSLQEHQLDVRLRLSSFAFFPPPELFHPGVQAKVLTTIPATM